MAKDKDEVKQAEEKAGFEVLGVRVQGKGIIREYAVAQHGPRTKEYAEEFAKKRGGTVEKVR